MKIMQYHHHWVVWQATCSMILIAATYATSPSPPTESRQRRPQQQQQQQQLQAEVSAKQIPARPLKFGEKVALPNEVFLPTQQSLNRSSGQTGRQSRRQQSGDRNDISAVSPAPRNGDRQRSVGQTSGRVEAQSVRTSMTELARRPERQRGPPITDQFLRTHLPEENSIENPRNAPVISEHISLPTHPPPQNSHLSRRRSGGGTGSNHVVVQQYEIPVVQKTHETMLYKPITPTVGQQRQQQQPPLPSNANRSRFSTANAEQPPTTHSQTDRAVATEAKRNNQQQTTQRRQQQSSSTLTARTNSHKNSQHSALTSSRNSNHNALSSHNNKSNSLNASYFNSLNNKKLPSQQYLNGADVGDRIPPKKVTTTAQQQRSPPPPASGRSTNTRKSSTTPRPLFSLPNEYNIFSPEFWRFLNPTTRTPHTTTPATTTTKRPPKKYIPPQQATLKEEKLNYPKAKPTLQPTKSTHAPEYKDNTPNKKDDGPFRIALPTFNILNPKRESVTESEKDKRDAEDGEDLRAKFNCPRESEVRFQLFPKICKVDDDCRVWNRGEICCEIFGAKSCVSGIPKPLEETSHSPILGLIPRKCPDRPLAELWWEVKECDTDMDCWPRVCCPDGRRRYCRTSQPELNTVPVPVKRSFNYLTEYLECTAPPPPIFDLHPKACTSTLDCFPNVCCQEAGLRHCRPPKKSVLTMLANVFNVDLVKRLTQNIVIK